MGKRASGGGRAGRPAVRRRPARPSPVGSVARRRGLAFFSGSTAWTFGTHRSVYLPVIRDQVPESLALFDFADPSLVTGDRATTTGPAQALYFLNAPFVIRQAEALAERVGATDRENAHRVEKVYRLALARVPTSGERDRATAFLRDFAARDRSTDPARAAWSAFCRRSSQREFRCLD